MLPVLLVHAELEPELAQPGEGVQEVGSAVPVVHVLTNLCKQNNTVLIVQYILFK